MNASRLCALQRSAAASQVRMATPTALRTAAGLELRRKPCPCSAFGLWSMVTTAVVLLLVVLVLVDRCTVPALVLLCIDS